MGWKSWRNFHFMIIELIKLKDLRIWLAWRNCIWRRIKYQSCQAWRTAESSKSSISGIKNWDQEPSLSSMSTVLRLYRAVWRSWTSQIPTCTKLSHFTTWRIWKCSIWREIRFWALRRRSVPYCRLWMVWEYWTWKAIQSPISPSTVTKSSSSPAPSSSSTTRMLPIKSESI